MGWLGWWICKPPGSYGCCRYTTRRQSNSIRALICKESAGDGMIWHSRLRAELYGWNLSIQRIDRIVDILLGVISLGKWLPSFIINRPLFLGLIRPSLVAFKNITRPVEVLTPIVDLLLKDAGLSSSRLAICTTAGMSHHVLFGRQVTVRCSHW